MEMDKVIITNLPAFYKIKLFNEIGREQKILVIFTGNDAAIRNRDFFDEEIKFSYQYLSPGSSWNKIRQIRKILNKTNYKKLIIGGWDEALLWTAAFVSPRHKNQLILESSYLESSTEGVKKWMKMTFLSRISKVYATGLSQIKLLEKLHYRGEYVRTGGVGLFNVVPQPAYQQKNEIKNFLYVGRFSEEKNLPFLIKYFNKFPEINFTLIGYGPQEESLKEVAKENITFVGPVSNKDMHLHYSKYDVLILASLHEVWGLVIEEALNNGLPALISDRIGSAEEWENQGVAVLFEPNEENSLDEAVKKLRDPLFYNYLSKNVSQINFSKISARQIKVYVD